MLFFVFSYLNDLDALTMEKMAKESLEVFLESRILGEYVSTDFKDEFKSPGETVVAAYPAEMEADRLPLRGTMSLSDATANSHSIKLNQHLYVANPFYDREKIKSEKDLVDFFFAPMARALAKKYDRTIQGETWASYLYTAGKLGTDLAYNQFVDAAALQSLNNVPEEGRNVVFGPLIGAQIRKSASFVDKLSLTDSSLVRTGVIGQIGGYVASETNSFRTIGQTTRVTGAINKVGGQAVGDTALTVDGFSAAITSGSWCKVDGVPYRIASTTGGATPTTITIANPLRAAVADDAVVVVYTPALADLAGTLAVGYEGAIAFDTVTPVEGQGVTLGTTGSPYSIVKVSGANIWLNRPLDTAVANNDPLFLMPGGNYGIGISKGSIQVVTRPLPNPAGGGVISSTAVGENFAIRITRSYVPLEAKEIVTMDCIMGVANHFPEYNVLFLG